MATITAKYPGQCKACGGSFPAGAQVEWSKGAGSRHVTCPAKSAAAPAAESAPIHVTVDCRDMGRPEGFEVGRSFRVSRGQHAGQVVTVVSEKMRYQSAQDNEDMGDCMGGGWWLHLGCRPATAEETARFEAEEAQAREAEATRRQRAAEEKAARAAAVAAAKAKLAEITAGMVATESHDASVLAPMQPGEALVVPVKWSEGDRQSTEVVERRALTGETVYFAYHHDFDDHRVTMYAPRHVVEASWVKVAERYRETPEQAREWLSKYHMCVGADWRQWLVEQSAVGAHA